MVSRTVADRLREEYFDLLPEIRCVAEHIEAAARYHLLAISRDLQTFEQIVVRSRVKECESAIEALRRRQEGAVFDPDNTYTLETLKDLAGIRVLAFPSVRLKQIDTVLQEPFKEWTPDPVVREDGEPLALKYWGYSSASQKVKGEYQIVPMLTGLFWEVEHSALYKPSPALRGVPRSPEMKEPIANVLQALRRFEETFEALVQQSSDDV